MVLAVAAVTLNTVLNTTYKNWDDQTYCANAVITWQTDVINRHTFYSGRYVQAFYLPEYTIASWPIFSALLAVLSGLHPAVIYRTLLPLFEIPAAFAIIWLLARRFFPASRKKAWLVLLYYLLFTLAAAEQIGTVSSEWWLVVNCWTARRWRSTSSCRWFCGCCFCWKIPPTPPGAAPCGPPCFLCARRPA